MASGGLARKTQRRTVAAVVERLKMRRIVGRELQRCGAGPCHLPRRSLCAPAVSLDIERYSDQQ